MNKIKRSQRGLNFLYADFVQKIKNYNWEDWTESGLVALLRDCAGSGERTAEAYSILKEIIRRKKDLSLFDTQLMAAYSMQQGRIAELPTGEGKTLAAVVTASVLALQKNSVHILVFNDYLARRDYNENLSIYLACGLTCGYIEESSGFEHRRAAYSCDVVYVSAKEAGFDYLRDFLCMEKEKLLFNTFPIALVDEADSILIDEARIPLVLAGDGSMAPPMAARISKAVLELRQCDIKVNPKDNQVWLTETGIKSMETKIQLENLYMTENAHVLAMINAALEARFLLKKDKDYIVKNGYVLVIDESTGRVVQNRRFHDLLHQAVEMQELGLHGASSVIYNSMSIHDFLLQYKMLCGMTGTAASSATELREMYNLEVEVIPPHTPCIRNDHPDSIFLDREEQQAAVISRVQRSHAKGQPVLIGTRSVRESECFSELLTKHNIKHSVLNARNDTEEAAIIAKAGRPYKVTISTNMAGRGVDIRLDGCNEKEAAFVRAAGGLCVISTGINRSLRVDDQLRGRAGRQGDPGESQFFVCLKDLTLETFFEIEFYRYKEYPKLLRRAQRMQEGKDAEARYMLERYSRVLEEQRKVVADYRRRILLDVSSPGIMQEEEPAIYLKLVDRAGKRGVTIAERKLVLYFINMHWASYLMAMEDKRSGIHLMIIANKNLLNEYQIFAVSAFNEMTADIKRDVVKHMQKCKIDENGIDMGEAGLSGATATWTYMINEDTGQFSRIPYLVKSMSNTIKGTLFTVRGIYAKLKKRR
ncbi:preprotein translocase subunit SecA [Anaerobacterium chartisolvens]|uniref:Protein translocase subunit SecA n=1 Tax=Anaerobacterium chartisolvens TaxID=1297424 RepID=A0A369B742_9FIRM|nr:accessory Sec system translocase SecA2 [Anaerobacterium chartisolvens]RCX16366.1 preprotein translocase subunit SecA [Anaerobacterium chartisolvens]